MLYWWNLIKSLDVSGRHTCRDCVSYNFGCRALHNLPWLSSVNSHQVHCNNIPTSEALLKKMCRPTCFLNDTRSPTMHGCTLWCSQIFFTGICPYSLNTATAFYFVTECPAVTFEGMCTPQRIRASPVLSRCWTPFLKHAIFVSFSEFSNVSSVAS